MKPLVKTLYLIALILVTSVTLAKDDNTLFGQGGTGIIINSYRNFDISQTTIVKEDGQQIPAIRGQGGTGFKVRFTVGSDVNSTMTGGTLEAIEYINTHKGPVTSLDPFRIFNVDALLTGDTFYDDGLTFDDLVVGEELKISGYVDTNSTLIVSRVERDNDPLTEWKLSGYVANLTATHFNIADQLVETGTALIDNCVGGLQNGDFVEIKSQPDAGFTSGSTMSSVTKIECVPPGVVGDPGATLPIALEGIVDFEDIEFNNMFSIAEQAVTVDLNTVYINGEVDDIVVGAKVEVEGFIDTTTSEITAIKVKFKEVRFKFEEPVLPGDVVVGESIQLFGRTILNTPQLRDEDGIIGSGLGLETQVEVRGYADSEGNLYATRVRERGNPDAADVNADGQITAIAEPFIEVYGVVVDTSASVFFDINNSPISLSQFFAQIEIGTEVEVEDSSVNEMTNVISAVIVRIDEPDDLDAPKTLAGFSQGLGIGTVTGLTDLIFKNSFD
ncbi:MAG: DUF5666 domain-containing protein [Marinicella sp.]|nr:hypothetical protein [Xanthomonadales bacterium]